MKTDSVNSKTTRIPLMEKERGEAYPAPPPIVTLTVLLLPYLPAISRVRRYVGIRYVVHHIRGKLLTSAVTGLAGLHGSWTVGVARIRDYGIDLGVSHR